jgi:hypothetical protein
LVKNQTGNRGLDLLFTIHDQRFTICTLTVNYQRRLQMSSQLEITPAAKEGVSSATVKEKFDLGIKMLQGYYDALEVRVERTAVLLVGIVGWLITSPSARDSLARYGWLFAGAIVSLTVFLIMTGLNISHFLQRFREVQANVADLNYAEPKDYTRYTMPPQLLRIPILLIYMSPIVILYILIVLLLCYVRFKLPAMELPK